MKRLTLLVIIGFGIMVFILVQAVPGQAEAAAVSFSGAGSGHVEIKPLPVSAGVASPFLQIAPTQCNLDTSTEEGECTFELRPGYTGTVHYSDKFDYPGDITNGCPGVYGSEESTCFAYFVAEAIKKSWGEWAATWQFWEPQDSTNHIEVCVFEEGADHPLAGPDDNCGLPYSIKKPGFFQPNATSRAW